MTRSTTSRPTGVISAPPMPCNTRNAVNATSPRDSPHRSEATVNTPIAATNVARAPTRSATHPLTGINTASVSRYAVIPIFIETTPT